MWQFLLELKNILLAEVGYIVLFFVPPAAVVFTFHRRYRRDKAEAESPFDEIRRRPAGESARLEIERLTDKTDPWLMMLVVIPALLAVSWSLAKQTLTGTIVIFLFCASAAAFVQWKLTPLVKRRAAFRLGYHGERYVAEELNQLMADGFKVFHDVPFETHNVDHVVAGPSGVFAIETKTKRKKIHHGPERYVVVFTGERLEFPGGWNVAWLDQARLNARTLSQWLRSSSAEPVNAEPILTIPGWWIEPKGTAKDIRVLNPKQILGVVRSVPQNVLNPEQIQRIAHQLEERCKMKID
ncbi:MAG TPA: nuclease-related domain-containing protein [Chthoniobacterales bacterium]|jgi:hypothetical protein|nr:nuclease-related domain-containing protein [Chthoniobacterales bacterium]